MVVVLQPDPLSEMICYIIIGLALLVANAPLFFVIATKRSLCLRYPLLLALFLNCSFIGINCFLIAGYSGSLVGKNDTNSESGESCLTKFGVWVDIYCFPMVAVCLLFIGIDRLLVVLSPIKYFLHQRLSVLIQAVLAHIITVIFFTLNVYFSRKRNVQNVSTYCRQHEFVPYNVYLTMLIIRIAASSIFIVLVAVSLVRLRTYTERVLPNENDEKLAVFMRRQRVLTRGIVFGCTYTIVFYILPSVGALCVHLIQSRELDKLITYFTFLSYLNQIPYSTIIFITQPEIRYATLKKFKVLAKLPYFNRFANEVSTSYVTRT